MPGGGPLLMASAALTLWSIARAKKNFFHVYRYVYCLQQPEANWQ